MNTELHEHFKTFSDSELTEILKSQSDQYTKEAIDCVIDVLKSRYVGLTGTNPIPKVIEYIEQQQHKINREAEQVDSEPIEQPHDCCNICGSSPPAEELLFYAGTKNDQNLQQKDNSFSTNEIVNSINMPSTGWADDYPDWVKTYRQMFEVSFLLCKECTGNHLRRGILTNKQKIDSTTVLEHSKALRFLVDECGCSLFDEDEFNNYFCDGIVDESNMLPEEIDCPHCNERLALADEERTRHQFTCPKCHGFVTGRDLEYIEADNVDKALPEFVKCTCCGSSVGLGESERKDRVFVCPYCEETISLEL